jgi:hypothetical protein
MQAIPRVMRTPPTKPRTLKLQGKVIDAITSCIRRRVTLLSDVGRPFEMKEGDLLPCQCLVFDLMSLLALNQYTRSIVGNHIPINIHLLSSSSNFPPFELYDIPISPKTQSFSVRDGGW